MAIATFGVIALDCPDPTDLAEFYAEVLGWKVDQEESDAAEGWVEIAGPDGGRLAFQRAENYVPPQWPHAENGQQMHLDLRVPRDQKDEAERQVLALGARLVEGDGGKRNWRVYLDPVGHPFCLCAD